MSDHRFARANPAPIPLDQLKIPDWDIREGRNEDDILDIARSMEKEAQMQPILLGEKDGQLWEIVDGVHRYLAAKRLGWEDVDAMRLEADVEDKTAAALSNLGRVVMSPTDTHQVIDYYLSNSNLQHNEVAAKLGVDPSTITRHAKISKGHNEIQSRYMQGDVSLKGAAALAQVPDRDAAISILNDAERLGLNTGEIKAMAASATARIKNEQAGPPHRGPSPTEQVRRDVQEKVRQHEAEMESDVGQALAQKSTRQAEQEATAPFSADPVPGEGESSGGGLHGPGGNPHGAPQTDPEHVCQICGIDYDPVNKATFSPPQPVRQELGVAQIEMCGGCAEQVYSGIQALQESEPAEG